MADKKRSADGSGMNVEGGAAKMHFRLLLPNKQTGTVIGKGGVNIKSIREASGCQVQISENLPGSTDRLVTIIGDSGLVNTAVARLLAIIDEDPQASVVVDTSPGERMLRCVLTNNEAGRIIGKGGARIKQMRTESGAQVRMDPESGADRIVGLVGTRDAIVEAHRQIVLTIADMPPDSGQGMVHASGAKRQQLGYPGAHPGVHAAHAAAAGYPPHQQLPMPLSGGGHPPAYGQQPPAYYAPPLPGYEQYPQMHGHPAAYAQPQQPYYAPPTAGYAAPPSAGYAGAPPAVGEAPPGVLEQLVSKDQAGRLIGRGGAGIRELRTRSRARIHITSECEPGTEHRKLTLTGSLEEVHEGLGAVLELLHASRA